MPRIRYSIRRLMIVVAVVGIVAAASIRYWMARQDLYNSANYSRLASKYRLVREQVEANREGVAIVLNVLDAAIADACKDSETRLSFVDELVEQQRASARGKIRDYETEVAKRWAELTLADRKIQYFEIMRLKYEFASQHPRLTVAPDPPEPK